MSKQKKKKPVKDSGFLVVLSTVAVLAVIVLIVALATGILEPEPTKGPTVNRPIKVEKPEDVNINLGYGLYMTEVASYTGVYMEDGTDEVVSGVLMIVVENTGDTDIQLAEIELPVGKKTAYFKLTTLPAGESAVLLETNKMAFADVNYTTAIAKNVVLFKEPLELHKDQFKIQILDGVINVSNISGKDIVGDVVIYYKNASSDMLYGGITYRVTISGGMRAGEIKQITGGHFSASGSRIMFVTVG